VVIRKKNLKPTYLQTSLGDIYKNDRDIISVVKKFEQLIEIRSLTKPDE